jgi:hypothetical protein
VPVSSEVDRAADTAELPKVPEAPDGPPEAPSEAQADDVPGRPLGRRMRALAARSRHPFAHGPAA